MKWSFLFLNEIDQLSRAETNELLQITDREATPLNTDTHTLSRVNLSRLVPYDNNNNKNEYDTNETRHGGKKAKNTKYYLLS